MFSKESIPFYSIGNMKNYFFIINLVFLIFSPVFSCSDKESNPLFSLIQSTDTGITFKNSLVEKYDDNILRSEYFYNGGGVSAGDINNDGLLDLYFVSNQGDNKLYLNQGNLKFKDITSIASVEGHNGWASGTSMIDINTDGYLDIYVSYTRSSKLTESVNQLFINKKNSTFIEGAITVNAHDRGQSNQTFFLDYDLDGDLDMFVTNHLTTYPRLKDTISILSKPSLKAGDKLYRNDELQFKDVTKEAGIHNHALGFSLGAAVGDVNQDGWPDIYIGNDFIEKDYLYINNKDGTFTDKSQDAFGHISNFSMGNDMADLNNDGLLDIISLDMANTNNFDTKTDMAGMNPEGFNKAVKAGFHQQYMYNTLQINMGNGQFSEVAKIAGIDATNWSWAPLVADFDNDGYKDLFITNGFRRNFRNKDFQKYQEKKYNSQQWTKKNIPVLMKDLLEHMPIKMEANQVFKNKDGYAFENKTKEWGFEQPTFSNGAIYADLDNDGDLDIVVNNIDQEASVYINNTNKVSKSNYLKVNFKGPKRNNFGLGTKVTLYTQGGKKQFAEHYMARGYRSSIPNGLHFGLGNNSSVDSLLVRWPDGKSQLLVNVKANQQLLINYKEAEKTNYRPNSKPKLFHNEDAVNHGIIFKHKENNFDDYKKQLLLPHKYSQSGPGVSVADVNKDDADDLYIGGASGQLSRLYLQKPNGTFTVQKGPWETYKNQEEISSVFFDANSDGYKDIYVVCGGYEWEHNDPAYQDHLYINNQDGTFRDATENLPEMVFSGSKVKPCDFDNDGDIDLFVGGRLIAQQYPLPASGYLLENNNGIFTEVSLKIAPELDTLGLITDALWEDIDGDKDKDLIVVGEWMPITVFINNKGTFKKSDNNKNGLLNTEGWWYSIASGDFDKDGDIDLIGGNLGLNYKYKASKEKPFEVYSSDFDNNHKLDIILGFHEDNKLFPLRGKQCSAEQMPFIKEKYKSYKTFASATIVDMVGKDKMDEALNFKTKTFATTYFENDGKGKFSAKAMPYLTQISSVNDMLVDDFNSDKNLDVVFIGNLYQSEVETPRNDASYGVVLLGNGKGGFNQQFPYESGLYVKGDSKDIDEITIKGENYLLITKNDEALQLVKFKKNKIEK